MLLGLTVKDTLSYEAEHLAQQLSAIKHLCVEAFRHRDNHAQRQLGVEMFSCSDHYLPMAKV